MKREAERRGVGAGHHWRAHAHQRADQRIGHREPVHRGLEIGGGEVAHPRDRHAPGVEGAHGVGHVGRLFGGEVGVDEAVGLHDHAHGQGRDAPRAGVAGAFGELPDARQVAVRPRQRARAQVGPGLVRCVFRHQVPDVAAQVFDAALSGGEGAVEAHLERDVAGYGDVQALRLGDDAPIRRRRDIVVDLDEIVAGGVLLPDRAGAVRAVVHDHAAGGVDHGGQRRGRQPLDDRAGRVDVGPGQFAARDAVAEVQRRRTAPQNADAGDAGGEEPAQRRRVLEVHVHVVEAGDQEAAPSVHARGAVGNVRLAGLGGWPDGDHAAAADQDGHVRQRALAVHRDDGDAFDGEGGLIDGGAGPGVFGAARGDQCTESRDSGGERNSRGERIPGGERRGSLCHRRSEGGGGGPNRGVKATWPSRKLAGKRRAA